MLEIFITFVVGLKSHICSIINLEICYQKAATAQLLPFH